MKESIDGPDQSSKASKVELIRVLDNHKLKVSFLSGSVLTVVLLMTTRYGYRKFYRRITNSEDVTSEMLRRSGEKRLPIRIKGFVTSVGDADNFRLYHTPGFGWNWLRKIPEKRSDLKDKTIHIRLAGVDAPELAHFGNPAQPFSKEALSHLEKLVYQRKVEVDLLSKDRYNRIVGMVFVKRWNFLPFRQNVSLSMVKAGLATVYRSSGAEYGSIYNQLVTAELRAKLSTKRNPSCLFFLYHFYLFIHLSAYI
ncbi:hypothetical protein BY996DRAFT_4583171 [Phakopsora pachyrhizi]|nr:hypothetical protein BY996DRAFT_4583171 [Phakopsora pachyrhizi]